VSVTLLPLQIVVAPEIFAVIPLLEMVATTVEAHPFASVTVAV
jgi:hypothetical protein